MQDQHPLEAEDEQGSTVPQDGMPLNSAAVPVAGQAAEDDSEEGYEDEQYDEDDETEEHAGYVRFRTPLFAVVATLLSLALLALIAGNVYQFVHNGNQQVVATVNGSPITQRDFNRTAGPTSQQVLDKLVGDKLALQAAQRQKVTISNSQIDTQIAQIKQQLGTQKDFQAALQSNDLTESQLRDEIKINLIEEQLGAKGITVSDAEAQAYYNQNKAQFGTQTYAQVKDQINAQLLPQKQSTAIETWIAGLRKNAKVVEHLPT